MSTISVDVVRHVAELARLEFSKEELARFASQLERIVGYVDQLREIPEEALPQVLDVTDTPLRSDVPVPEDGRRALTQNAPEMSHGHVVVPRVVGVTP